MGVLVAVPRSVLPETFVWAPRRSEPWVRRFSLPRYEGPAPRVTPQTLGRESITQSRGTVDLPAAGTLALRSLDDGRQVWVSHHADGTIAVIGADFVPRPDTAMRQRVSWQSRTQRFSTGHDSFGRSVTGGASLPTHEYRREGSRIEVGALAELSDGPIVPRENAPALVIVDGFGGAAGAYRLSATRITE